MSAPSKASPSFGRLLAMAAGDALHLLSGGAVVGASILLRSWLMLAIGAATYMALIAWRASRPGYAKKLMQAEAAARRRLPDPATVCDAGLRAAVMAILAARNE